MTLTMQSSIKYTRDKKKKLKDCINLQQQHPNKDEPIPFVFLYATLHGPANIYKCVGSLTSTTVSNYGATEDVIVFLRQNRNCKYSRQNFTTGTC